MQGSLSGSLLWKLMSAINQRPICLATSSVAMLDIRAESQFPAVSQGALNREPRKPAKYSRHAIRRHRPESLIFL